MTRKARIMKRLLAILAGLSWMIFVLGCVPLAYEPDPPMGDDDVGDDDVGDDDDGGDDDGGDDDGGDDDVGDDDAGDDDAGDDDAGDDDATPADCSQISQANGAWEVCETGADYCNGVYTDGAGCGAYCGAAGMVCVARFGGDTGCVKEPQNVWNCNDNNGHLSDWCECEFPAGDDDAGDDDVGDDDSCTEDPGNPPYQMELDYTVAAYSQRHNWVLTCYPYAYTAGSAEHQACDNQYFPDGSRTGTATFTFNNVPRGMYDAYMGGRHTENRNPSGALFIVDGHAVAIDQVDASGDYVWDYHGQHCLEGTVEVMLDSSVNNGSDSVFGVRLVP
jgi:hypothetical protein